MQEAFGTLIWIVAAGGAIVAIFTLIRTGRSYEEIGGGEIVHDRDGGAGDGDGGSAAERDEEIAQMVQARNARRARRGEAPLEAEAQLAALRQAPPAVDAELREEIRQHVLARNARRVRAGSEPLDVEAEIERRIHQPN